jgi:hypothetical protein
MTLQKLLLGTAIALAMISPAAAEINCAQWNPPLPSCEQINRKQAEEMQRDSALAEQRQRETDAIYADAKRQAEAQQAVYAAQARELERKRAEAQATHDEWLSHPANRLNAAYQTYMYAQACDQARKGYWLVWINDVEMKRLRSALTTFEEAIVQEDHTVDATAEWKRAESLRPKGQPVYQYGCRTAYNNLMQLAPLEPIKDFGEKN